MPKNWKAIAVIAAFVIMHLVSRITGLVADVAICAAVYLYLMNEYKSGTPKE
ncbi:hypothetical protein LVR82_19455 [Klebsiella variicola subsp. variicola]|uniref:hypothetical protein n=1 Tax=Klebsiella variicola TaxID=244366 RepID=UPI001E3F5638|nr:hypothetical protein [Klebsiella variicola]MCD9775852.1 hypothetical protein [Klebsiella variicola subsp. variicola]